MSPGRARHPDRLPWFASGHLDPADSAAIEQHVQGCESCRVEVSALRSMYRSLREDAPSTHVAPARLVAYHDRDSQFSRDERRWIEAHLQDCHTCSADLAALARADRSTRARHGRRMLGAAASVLIVVTLGWQIALRRAEAPASPAVTRVIVSPARRGTSAAPRLLGAGPWELEVWLPVHAQAREFRACIERSDEPSKSVVDRVVTAAPKGGSVLLRVPGGLLPGHYVLSLIPLDHGDTQDIVNGFDVETAR